MKNFNWALFALSVSAFGIGSTEFVIMGILPQVSHSFQVSIPKAGLLVSVYALGVAVGAPILAALTRNICRRYALLLLLGIFIVGNIFCALAANYWLMMLARIVTSFAHGAFFGIGAIVATKVVRPEKKASAIALMFMGLTLANVIGVPFGTWVAHHWNWHLSFWMITAVGVLAFALTYAFIPRCGETESIHFMNELSALKDKKVLLALLSTILTFASVLALFTYIAPILLDITKLPLHWISFALLVIGVGTTVGNLWGGKLADRSIYRALLLTTALFLLMTLIFYVVRHQTYLAVIVLFFWGMMAFATIPPLQFNVVQAAKKAPNLASTLNIGAFNIGNAAGAFFGGLGFSLMHNASGAIIMAILLAIVALAFAFFSLKRVIA